MAKSKYKYNFSNFMGQCELNYMLLYRLFPDMDSEDGVEYKIRERYKFNILVTERHRYTICLRISIHSPKQPDWLPETGVEVRLYHDAHLAEVVNKRGGAMQPVNSYPNPDMKQKDEKQGLNKFLGEWLSFCLKYGESTVEITSETLSGYARKGE